MAFYGRSSLGVLFCTRSSTSVTTTTRSRRAFARPSLLSTGFSKRVSVCALLSTLLVGCGGGGSSSSAPSTPNPPPGPTPSPFGLTVRPTLGAVDLPIVAGGGSGTYELVNQFPGLSFPNALFLTAVPGESRLAVLQKTGFMRVFENDSAANASRLVLDLSSRVFTVSEAGLLGLAFDPGFVSNRFLYVHYSVTDSGQHISRISRFTWDAASDLIDVGSEKVIIEIPQPFANHNGGMLAFGPDDLLYIALGDGGDGGDPGNRSQNLSNLLGSMLRIDVHPANPADPYDIPLNNPFVGQAGARGEIYAYGLRNPFRFSFDRSNGDLWLGDVGQSAREEIDLIVAGGNYGWRVYEGNVDTNLGGSLPRANAEFPVLDYGRSDGQAVIGGYVYRGTRVASLVGRYLYSDFGSGTVWALDYDGSNVVANDAIATANSPTSFGETNTGDVLVVGRNNGIFRIDETGGGGGTIPDLLSDTALFANLGTLQPAAGFVAYDINVAFWSDGARKQRWFAVPNGEQIGFSATGAWTFPVGTIALKHFELALDERDADNRRRLETRVLVLTDTGWRGFTYRWNAGQTDAQLVSGRETETLTITAPDGGTRTQLYEYPAQTDCLGCHTDAAGRVLGIRTRQLNRDFAYAAATDNQLRALNNVDYFSSDLGDTSAFEQFPDIADTGADLATRARAYLQVNCAHCHQPNGPTPVSVDLRSDTALASANMLNTIPEAGDLGVAGAAIVTPGDRSASVLFLRMLRLDAERMPPLSSHVVDPDGSELVGAWIDSL